MSDSFPLRVCSFKRSGTHLLMATLYQNFELPDACITTILPGNIKFISDTDTYFPGQRAVIPWGKLHATHGFYRGASDSIIYIVRHPISTLISYWRLYGSLDERFGKDLNSWCTHAKGYTSNCFWIRYEDLVGEKHDETLEKIASRFDLTPKQSSFSRLEKHVGFYPIKYHARSEKLTPEITEKFKKFFPDGVLGYDMSVLNTYHEDTCTR